MRLSGKIAIVTGGGSGFGEGIAKRFAEEGCKVIVNDINTDGGERVVKEIKASGGDAAFIKGDVSKDGDWAAMLKFSLDTYGDLDIVINNAGTTHRNQPLLDVAEKDFDRVYAVNVKSLYYSARNKIRVNVVNPVAGDTPLLAEFMGADTPEMRAKFVATIPLGRFSQPRDIANACLYLASDEADFITGACIEVDGGRCV